MSREVAVGGNTAGAGVETYEPVSPKEKKVKHMTGYTQGSPWMITVFLVAVFLLGWHLATLRPAFDAKGLTEEQLTLMEFNGDIIRAADGSYTWNPEKEKVKGIPGPLTVIEKAREELSEALIKKGTNDHGIGYLCCIPSRASGQGFLPPPSLLSFWASS
ncbi:hypothetical protein [Petrachloros mirabilis]